MPPVVKELPQDITAVTALCFQETTELSLRQHDNAAELVRIQTNNLSDLRRYVVVSTAFLIPGGSKYRSVL